MRLVESEITRVGGGNEVSKGSQRFLIYPLELDFSLKHGISKRVNPEETV